MKNTLNLVNVALIGLAATGCGQMKAADMSAGVDTTKEYVVAKSTILMGDAAYSPSAASIKIASMSSPTYSCDGCAAWQQVNTNILAIFSASIDMDFNSCVAEGSAKKHNQLDGTYFYSTGTEMVNGSPVARTWKARVLVVGKTTQYEMFRCSGGVQDRYETSNDTGSSATLTHKTAGTNAINMTFTGTYSTYRNSAIVNGKYTTKSTWLTKGQVYDAYNSSTNAATHSEMIQSYSDVYLKSATQNFSDSSQNVNLYSWAGLTAGYTDKNTQVMNADSQIQFGTSAIQGELFSQVVDGGAGETPMEVQDDYATDGDVDVMSTPLMSLPSNPNISFASWEQWDCTIPSGAAQVGAQEFMQTGSTDLTAMACSAAF